MLFGTLRKRRRSATALGSLTATALAAGLLAFGSHRSSVEACGGTPPPPFCAKTLAFGKAAPGVLLLTGGGTFFVPTVAFIGIAGNACPQPPFSATYTMTLTCIGGPGGSGTLTVPVFPGFNTVSVPVTVPAGPPRICFLSGTVTVTFPDGMVLSQTADQVICIVDPSPDDPSVPRLDLQHLDNPIQGSHPGDQIQNRYLLTNNDPTESWTGEVTADSRNVADLPDMPGPPGPPGTGIYAIADPGPGDNWPIMFAEDLPPNGCIPLPPDPQNQILSETTKTVTLAPGESRLITAVVRSWGMCANGSCSESSVVVEGTFANGDEGLACAGTALFLDTAIPPQYAWEDSGATMTVCPPFENAPFLELQGQPLPDPTSHWQGQAFSEPPFIQTPDGPLPFVAKPLSACLDDPFQQNYGRIGQVLFNPDGQPLFNVDSFFDIAYQIQLPPLPGGGFMEVQDMFLIPGAPAGFEQVAPLGMGLALVNNQFNVDSFFDITYQIEIEAVTQNGNRYPVEFLALDLGPIGPGFQGGGQVFVPVNPSDPVTALEVHHDLRGYARGIPAPPCVGDIDGDGIVSFTDLLAVLSSWGPCAGCPTDLDGDTNVGFSDLLIVLAAWGPC